MQVCNYSGLPDFESAGQIIQNLKCASIIKDHLQSHLLSLIFHDRCRNIGDNTVNALQNCDFKSHLSDESLQHIDQAIANCRTLLSTNQPASSVKQMPSLLQVRLKGQEKYHSQNMLCTADGQYTGDDRTTRCVLKDPCYVNLSSDAQLYGYREIYFSASALSGLYTQDLGPCIGILAVGIDKQQKCCKAALMHEDYSSVPMSVTHIFENSFQENLQDLSAIEFFLVGGNGGEQYTAERFAIHKSEIQQLKEKFPNTRLASTADARNSTEKCHEWDLTHLFFTVVDTSAYLWTAHEGSGGRSLEVTHVAGDEMPLAALAACYQSSIQGIS